jgi:hypothetical protein
MPKGKLRGGSYWYRPTYALSCKGVQGSHTFPSSAIPAPSLILCLYSLSPHTPVASYTAQPQCLRVPVLPGLYCYIYAFGTEIGIVEQCQRLGDDGVRTKVSMREN